jgi:hypothetical protein
MFSQSDVVFLACTSSLAELSDSYTVLTRLGPEDWPSVRGTSGDDVQDKGLSRLKVGAFSPERTKLFHRAFSE